MRLFGRRVEALDLVMWGIGAVLVLGVLIGSVNILQSGKYGPSQWLDFIIFGLAQGSLYALIALGYTLVYGIIELINFAHGDVFMIGTFVSFGFFGTIGLTESSSGVPLYLGMLLTLFLAMVACGVLNTMIERVAYRPLRGAPKLAPLITAVGFSFILQNVGLLWLGGSHKSVPDLIGSQDHLFTLGALELARDDFCARVAALTAQAAVEGSWRERFPRVSPADLAQSA